MNHKDREQLLQWISRLTEIQDGLDAMLARQTAWKKTLRKQDPEYDAADLICDSLGYAVDDLDSVLENLDELTSEE